MDMTGLEPASSSAQLTVLDSVGNRTQANVTWDWKGTHDDYVVSMRGIHHGINGLETADRGAVFCPGPDQAGWVTLMVEQVHGGDKVSVAELLARIHFHYDEANNQVMLGNAAFESNTLASDFRLVHQQVGGLRSVWAPAAINAWVKAQLEAWGSASITMAGTKVSTEMQLFSRTVFIDFMLYSDGTCEVTGNPRDTWVD